MYNQICFYEEIRHRIFPGGMGKGHGTLVSSVFKVSSEIKAKPYYIRERKYEILAQDTGD